MHEILLKTTSFDTVIKNSKVKLSDKQAVLEEFMDILDDYNFWFNIVTP